MSDYRRAQASILTLVFVASTGIAATPNGARSQPTLTPAGLGHAADTSGPMAPASARRIDGMGGAAVPPIRTGWFGRDSAWWVPLSSTIVPGSGQLRLGQDRFVAYVAIEAYAIIGWASSEAGVTRERRRYLALAHDIARAFVPGNDAVGTWDYYEAMEKHLESGVFDRTPGTGSLAPETDTTTFNGSTWLKARQLSDWPSVDVEPPHMSVAYQNAITYYIAHAVGPQYTWSWRNAQLEWDVYRQSIRRKNDASHQATDYLAVIAFNHLLSTVDAFVTLRLRGGLGADRRGYSLTATLPLP